MPIETRWFVKTGLAWLVLTFAFGAYLLGEKAFGVTAPSWAAVVHAHAGFVGWLVNLVMGIALWFLPVNRARFPKSRGRYPEGAVWTIFGLLNVGLVLRLVGEPLIDSSAHNIATQTLLVVAGAMQLAAVTLFVSIAWWRVRSVD